MTTGQGSGYQPAIYREQGGKRLVIDSTGELDILSGGHMDVESGGYIAIASGGYLSVGGYITVPSAGYISVASGGYVSVASGGYVAMPAHTRTTTNVATAIPNYGICSLVATTTGPTYTLAVPVAGTEVVLHVTSNTSSGTCNVNTNSTGVAVSSTGGNQLQFNAVNDAVRLTAQSATRWVICGNVGSVATATRST